jgi:hypothetical protein
MPMVALHLTLTAARCKHAGSEYPNDTPIGNIGNLVQAPLSNITFQVEAHCK